jgi:hypothetical protein
MKAQPSKRTKPGLFRRLFMWCRGIVWQSEDKTMTLYRNGYVVTTDGESSDAVPLILCSHKLISRINADLEI